MSDSIQPANPTFSAATSMLGYLYQCSFALFESLRRLADEQEFSVEIETQDDVVFDTTTSGLLALQLKHHLSNSATLTDTSVDFWKTIRIWSTEYKASNSNRYTHFLLTTGKISNGDAASFLCEFDNQRDPLKAVELLDKARAASTNDALEKSFIAYDALSGNDKAGLFSNAYVMGNTPNAMDIYKEIRRLTGLSVRPYCLNAYIDRLMGWWFNKCVGQLCKVNGPVLSSELRSIIDLLNYQLQDDNLPIDDEIFSIEAEPGEYIHRDFVKQLEIIGLGKRSITSAIREYFQAITQRTRWAQDGLLTPGEIERYSLRLREDWKRFSALYWDGLSSEPDDEELVRIGKKTYAHVQLQQLIPIRRACVEGLIARGSYQVLSDLRQVGWHPEYQNRLASQESEEREA